MKSLRPGRARRHPRRPGAIALWSVLALLTAAAGAVPPFELAALTFAIGGGFGLLYAAAAAASPRSASRGRCGSVGVGGLFGYHALYFAALSRAPPAEASLINYLWPLLIVLMSALLPGERLRPRHVVGAALGFAGAASLFVGKIAGGFSLVALDKRDASGYALALACAVVWWGYSVLSRRLKAAPTEAVAGFCLATSALAALCHFAFRPPSTDRLRVMGGDRRPRARPGRPRLLCLGLRGQARRPQAARRRRLRRAGAETLVLVAAGFAPATLTLALACALIIGGAAVAARRG